MGMELTMRPNMTLAMLPQTAGARVRTPLLNEKLRARGCSSQLHRSGDVAWGRWTHDVSPNLSRHSTGDTANSHP